MEEKATDWGKHSWADVGYALLIGLGMCLLAFVMVGIPKLTEKVTVLSNETYEVSGVEFAKGSLLKPSTVTVEIPNGTVTADKSDVTFYRTDKPTYAVVRNEKSNRRAGDYVVIDLYVEDLDVIDISDDYLSVYNEGLWFEKIKKRG